MRPTLLLFAALPALMAQESPQAPLTLDDAISSALGLQPQLKASEQNIEVSQARADQVRMDQLGKLDMSLTYLPWQKPLTLSFGIPGVLLPTPVEFKFQQDYAFQAGITQPLWTWGNPRHVAWKAMTEEVTANRFQYDRSKQQLVFEASRAYYMAAQAEVGVDVAQKAVDQQKAFLQVASSRVNAGAAARVDQLKAELGLAQAESNLLEAANRARIARENLATLTVDPRFRTQRLVIELPEFPEPPAEQVAMDTAIAQRPDLKALHHQYQSLDMGSRAAKDFGTPTLNLKASITQQNDAVGNLFIQASQQYAVGFSLTWEATSPWRSRYRSAELAAQARAVSYQSKYVQDNLALEIRSSLATLKEAQDRFALQGRALKVAEEQARIARVGYAEGVLTSVDLQEAELGLTDARYRRLRAAVEAAIAQAALKLAMGG